MNKIHSENAKNAFNKSVGRIKGLEIWRIAKSEAVPYPKNDYGKFYTADSFIVLNTKEANGVLSHYIHFWLGKETTQDEAGSAAILTVHLEEYLGGAPVQHREVQEHESALFLSYFKKGIRYMAGGVERGINKVTSNAADEQRLYHIKGKRDVRIRQVAVSVKSMNKNDYFVLDCGYKVFVYPSSNANIIQKTIANEIAKQIQDQDHNGRCSVHILDHPISFEDRAQFFGFLRCSSTSPELPDTPEEDDDAIEMKENATVTLYNAFTKTGVMDVSDYTSELVKISAKSLIQDMLNTESCYILDAGYAIFVWVGKKSTTDDKSHAILKAQEFISNFKYPSCTQIHRIVEGAESVQFKQYFSTWREAKQLTIQHKHINGKETAEFDPKTLHSAKTDGKGVFMNDNGKGHLELWLVQNCELVIVPDDMRGMFFDENCYIMRYSPQQRKGGVVYFWQGKHASVVDKGVSALQTVDIACKMIGGAIEVLVNQGCEPCHFLKIFKLKFIILFGNNEEFVKNKDAKIKPSGIQFYKIHGTTEDNVHAEQLLPLTASLASDDTFILTTPTSTYVWNGVGTNDFEKKMAKESVERLSPDSNPNIVQEGFEPPDFWKALGGKGDYDKDLYKLGTPYLDSRLFHCKVLSNGKFVVKEILNFFQEYLDVDSVFILDGGEEICVWEGSKASKEEKEKTMELASTYIRTDPSARTPESVPIITIQQGKEPRNFKQLFPKWKNNFWKT